MTNSGFVFAIPSCGGTRLRWSLDWGRLARRGVVVTVNYHINVFGFMAHSFLTFSADVFLVTSG